MTSLSAVTWKDMMEWRFHSLPEWKKAAITKVLGMGKREGGRKEKALK